MNDRVDASLVTQAACNCGAAKDRQQLACGCQLHAARMQHIQLLSSLRINPEVNTNHLLILVVLLGSLLAVKELVKSASDCA